MYFYIKKTVDMMYSFWICCSAGNYKMTHPVSYSIFFEYPLISNISLNQISDAIYILCLFLDHLMPLDCG